MLLRVYFHVKERVWIGEGLWCAVKDFYSVRNSNERRGVSHDVRNSVSSVMVVFKRFLSWMELA